MSRLCNGQVLSLLALKLPKQVVVFWFLSPRLAARGWLPHQPPLLSLFHAWGLNVLGQLL